MQLLQDQDDGSNAGSGAHGLDRARGFLEDPDRVGLDWHNSLGTRVVAYPFDAEVETPFDLPTFGLSGYVQRFGLLRWSHLGALLRLEGASTQWLVAPYVILQGRERPVHSPCPGVDGAVLARVSTNEQGLPVQKLFELLHGHVLATS